MLTIVWSVVAFVILYFVISAFIDYETAEEMEKFDKEMEKYEREVNREMEKFQREMEQFR